MDINVQHLTRAAEPAVAPEVERLARAEVKATLRLGETILIATQHGLLRLDPGDLPHLLPGLPHTEVRALGPATGGFVAAYGDEIILADGTGRVESRRTAPAGEKVACATAVAGRVLVGTKTGVFAAESGGWSRLLGGPGFEVTRLWELPGRLLAGVKKGGEARRPALAESLDGGTTWKVEEMGDYGDVVVAADARRIVTRWRGARARGGPTSGYKKHPITAAELLADGGVVVVDGDKVEISGPGRRKAEIFHPMLAEAEHVHLGRDGILFAGVQGAYLFDPLTWRMTDLLKGMFAGRTLGKRKRLFALDAGALLLTCSFGTFRSTDGGHRWMAADSEWDVLDAERLARAPDGRWFLLCQRGLFASRDNGARWDYVKPKLPGGARHFGELRSLAVGGGRLWLGTKAGLFAAPLDDVERLVPVDAAGDAPIEALLHDEAWGGLMMSVEGRGLMRLDAGGTAHPFAAAALHEATLVRDGDTLLAAGETGLSAITADGAVRDAAPPGAEGPISLLAGEDRLLAWSRTRAWQRRPRQAAWREVEGWPAGTRSAALLPGGGVVLTDRARLTVLDLPDAG